MTMMSNDKTKCRKDRIRQIENTLAGSILSLLESLYNESDKDGWTWNPRLAGLLTNEQRCLLRGWDALGLVSFQSTLGQDFLNIKDWNWTVRKVYFRTMKEIAA
jgi:hypothetical protein